jgi:hypothetical protein
MENSSYLFSIKVDGLDDEMVTYCSWAYRHLLFFPTFKHIGRIK